VSELPAEMQLLRACFRSCLPEESLRVDIAPLLAQLNWDHVLWLAHGQRALLVLDDVLGRPRWARLSPPKILPQLAAFREVNQMRALGRGGETCRLQDLFDGHDVPAIPVDRWVFEQMSHGRPDLEDARGTLRYLVPARDRCRAEAMLLEAGHPCKNDPSKLITMGKHPVALNEVLAEHPDAGRLWSQATASEMGGRTLLQLAPVHWLLHLVARRRGTSRPSLRGAWSLVAFVQRRSDWDWPAVMSEAERFGLAQSVCSDLAASHRELDVPLPGSLAGLLAPDARPISDRPRAKQPSTFPTSPFLPTPPIVVERTLELAGAGSGDLVYDLGCGDGRVIVAAAKRFGARGFGVDSDPVRISEAVRMAAEEGVSDRASFACGELFDTNLADATILYLYLLPPLYPSMHQKILREAKPGLRVVSHDYFFPGWPPDMTEILRTSLTTVSQIYVWRVR